MVQISSAQYEHIEKSMDNQKISDGSHSISLPQNHLKKKNSDEEKQIIQRSNVLYRKRRRITDFSLAMIISGLIFMITDNQLVWKNIIDRNSAVSHVLKTLIVVTTVLLVTSIMVYHYFDLQVRMLSKNIQDWRVGIDGKFVAKVVVEVLICSVCPFPGTGTFRWLTTRSNGMEVVTDSVPNDVLLSLPMFLRLYLIFRVFVQHSKVFNDIRTRSIGAMNNLHFNTEFILKWAMNYFPIRLLLAFVTIYVTSAAYILHLCEREQLVDPNNLSSGRSFEHYGNCLWLVAITFLTVGYGDVIPNTQPGRLVCVVTGFVGVSLSSILVAVLSSKLHLTTAERNVHNFMANNLLTTSKRNAAATIVQKMWRIHRLRKKLGEKSRIGEIRNQQRIFLAAVNTFRDTKRGLKEMELFTPSSAPTKDIGTMVEQILVELKRLREEQQIFVERVRNLEESKRPPSAGEQDEITEAEEIKQSLAIIASDIETIKKSVANVHRDQPFFKAKPPVPILQ